MGAVLSLSSETLPDVISIRQNFPNPFNPATEIRFDVFNTRWVRVDIYDLNGKIINELMSQVCQPGTYRIIWNGRNSKDQQIPSGVYFYNVQCGTVIKTGKMILLR